MKMPSDKIYACDICQFALYAGKIQESDNGTYYFSCAKCGASLPLESRATIAGYAQTLRECADIAEERQAAYGPPKENFEDIRLICKHAFGLELSKEAIANVMVATKLARNLHQKKKDNTLDAINYLAIAEHIKEIQWPGEGGPTIANPNQ